MTGATDGLGAGARRYWQDEDLARSADFDRRQEDYHRETTGRMGAECSLRCDLRRDRATIADLTRQLAEARAETATAEREGMEQAAKLADAYTTWPLADAVRHAGAMEVAALIRASLPPSNAAEPEAEEGTR